MQLPLLGEDVEKTVIQRSVQMALRLSGSGSSSQAWKRGGLLARLAWEDFREKQRETR